MTSKSFQILQKRNPHPRDQKPLIQSFENSLNLTWFEVKFLHVFGQSLLVIYTRFPSLNASFLVKSKPLMLEEALPCLKLSKIAWNPFPLITWRLRSYSPYTSSISLVPYSNPTHVLRDASPMPWGPQLYPLMALIRLEQRHGGTADSQWRPWLSSSQAFLFISLSPP